MPVVKLTQRFVDALPETEKLTMYFDSATTGFGVYTKGKVKTYFVQARAEKKLIKMTIGRANIFSLTDARSEAKEKLAQLAKGIDPVAEKRKQSVASISLEESINKYLNTRTLKPGTVTTYNKLFRLYMADWMAKPIATITKDMVAQRHKKISSENGASPANNMMRTFRAVYNFARAISDDAIPENPVRRLNDTRQWNKVVRRQSFLKPHELKPWYDAAKRISNPIIRDYILLILFSGLRENEGLKLKWENVDMKDRSFTVTVTKNGRPHTLPMSNFIYGLFKNLLHLQINEFVFPGSGKSGHLVESVKQLNFITDQTFCDLNGVKSKEELQQKVKRHPNTKIIPGIKFCLHDLRRTFITVAESLDIPYAALKRLLNHSDGNDVTGGYLQITTDRLREPMERISNRLVELMTVSKNREI